MRVFWLIFLLTLAAAAKPLQTSFQVVGGHLIKVPVRVNDTHESFFILDTGIGLNLLSRTLAQKFNLGISGSYKGQRMSGQELEVPLSRLEGLSLMGRRQAMVPVGLWDMAGLLPPTDEFKDVEGFLSLGYFRDLPFTLDYAKNLLILEDEASLAARLRAGQSVAVRLDGEKEPALTLSLALSLPDATPVRALLDTGSDCLILELDYMERLRLAADDPTVTLKQGQDETGHSFTRYFTTLPGAVRLLDAPDFALKSPRVMFQKIIHQGLLGQAFLRSYTVTFDLARSRLIFAKPPGYHATP